MSRQSPPAHLQGHTNRAWQWVCRCACLLALSGTSTWWLLLWQQGTAPLAGLAAVPLACLVAAVPVWRLGNLPPWQLQWDGQCWHWRCASLAGTCTVQPALDLQSWLLLRVSLPEAPLRPRWVALSQAEHHAAWHTLRCALYCPRPTAHTLPLPEEEPLVGKA